MDNKFKLLRGAESHMRHTNDGRLRFCLNFIRSNEFEIVLYVLFEGAYIQYRGILLDRHSDFSEYILYVDYLVDWYNEPFSMEIHRELNAVSTGYECRIFAENIIKKFSDRFG